MEKVKHPKHYNKHPSGVECIDIIEHMDFLCGSAIKYIWRADHKENAIQDLEKAIFCLQREIQRRAKSEEERSRELNRCESASCNSTAISFRQDKETNNEKGSLSTPKHIIQYNEAWTDTGGVSREAGVYSKTKSSESRKIRKSIRDRSIS